MITQRVELHVQIAHVQSELFNSSFSTLDPKLLNNGSRTFCLQGYTQYNQKNLIAAPFFYWQFESFVFIFFSFDAQMHEMKLGKHSLSVWCFKASKLHLW